MDEAFRGSGIEASNESQALLTNLATVTADLWPALPAGAARSIESIALHVGACKSHVRRLRLRPGHEAVRHAGRGTVGRGSAPRDAVIAWLEPPTSASSGHVRALGRDGELDRPRGRPTGASCARPAGSSPRSITHDAYHAGDIQPPRGARSPRDDRWRFQQLGYGWTPRTEPPDWALAGSWDALDGSPPTPSPEAGTGGRPRRQGPPRLPPARSASRARRLRRHPGGPRRAPGRPAARRRVGGGRGRAG